MATLVVLIVLSVFSSLVYCRPGTAYCCLPCPFTQPCSKPYYADEYWGRSAPYAPVPCVYFESERKDEPKSVPNDTPSDPSPTKTDAPAPPAPPEPAPVPKRRNGLFTSLFSIPGAVADTLLTGEITI